MVTCLSCGGRYERVLADGTQYFHQCPPLSAVELQAAVDDGRVTLPKGETIDIALSRRTYERASKRDENLPSTAAADAGKLKAPGLGISDDAHAAPIVVVVDPAVPVVVDPPVPLPPV